MQQANINLPHYVPMIHHGSRRNEPLDWPVVALDTYRVIRLKNGAYRTCVNSADELRAKFRLSPNTKIVLRGVAPDAPLELYWEYRSVENAPEQLRRLGVTAVIGPNFSHFLDVPRTDNLFNRKRQLICLDELSRSGHHTIPHLNAVKPGDWRFWLEFLQANTVIRHVAIEFQTGNKNKTQGRRQIEQLDDLAAKLGRPIHPILIGGRQHLPHAARRFPRFTLIDSTPFMKSMNRQQLAGTDGGAEWRETFTLERQPLDHILASNLEKYNSLIEQEAQGCCDFARGSSRGRTGTLAAP